MFPNLYQIGYVSKLILVTKSRITKFSIVFLDNISKLDVKLGYKVVHVQIRAIDLTVRLT